jgi:lipopolysaccharide export system protein LptA
VDATRGRAEGWAVRLSDGTRTFTAPRLVLDRDRGTGRLEGGVRGEGPEGTLRGRALEVRFTPRLELTWVALLGEAQLRSGDRVVSGERITLDPRTGVAAAEGAPVVRIGEAEIRARRIVYRSRAGTASASGPCTVRTPEGTLWGSGVEADLRRQVVAVSGPLRFTLRDASGSADRAGVALGEGRAVLEGHVRVRWRASMIEAGRVVVWYRWNRIVIEDESRIRIGTEDAGR